MIDIIVGNVGGLVNVGAKSVDGDVAQGNITNNDVGEAYSAIEVLDSQQSVQTVRKRVAAFGIHSKHRLGYDGEVIDIDANEVISPGAKSHIADFHACIEVLIGHFVGNACELLRLQGAGDTYHQRQHRKHQCHHEPCRNEQKSLPHRYMFILCHNDNVITNLGAVCSPRICGW